jgi:hypothetical protein
MTEKDLQKLKDLLVKASKELSGNFFRVEKGERIKRTSNSTSTTYF